MEMYQIIHENHPAIQTENIINIDRVITGGNIDIQMRVRHGTKALDHIRIVIDSLVPVLVLYSVIYSLHLVSVLRWVRYWADSVVTAITRPGIKRSKVGKIEIEILSTGVGVGDDKWKTIMDRGESGNLNVLICKSKGGERPDKLDETYDRQTTNDFGLTIWYKHLGMIYAGRSDSLERFTGYV